MALDFLIKLKCSIRAKGAGGVPASQRSPLTRKLFSHGLWTMTFSGGGGLVLESRLSLFLLSNNNNDRPEQQGLHQPLGSEGVLTKEVGLFLFYLRHSILKLCATQSGLDG